MAAALTESWYGVALSAVTESAVVAVLAVVRSWTAVAVASAPSVLLDNFVAPPKWPRTVVATEDVVVPAVAVAWQKGTNGFGVGGRILLLLKSYNMVGEADRARRSVFF